MGCEEGELVADTGAEGALSGGLEFGLLRPGESGGVSSVYYHGVGFYTHPFLNIVVVGGYSSRCRSQGSTAGEGRHPTSTPSAG